MWKSYCLYAAVTIGIFLYFIFAVLLIRRDGFFRIIVFFLEKTHIYRDMIRYIQKRDDVSVRKEAFMAHITLSLVFDTGRKCRLCIFLVHFRFPIWDFVKINLLKRQSLQATQSFFLFLPSHLLVGRFFVQKKEISSVFFLLLYIHIL